MSTPSLTDVFNELSHLTPQEQPEAANSSSNAHHEHRGLLSKLSPTDLDQCRSILLTLHVLFPLELLPALDLLDRKLVTRFVANLSTAAAGTDHSSPIGNAVDVQASEVFYIRSASVSTQYNPRQRHSNAGSTPMLYEVRLDSWNCTCPAFTVSTFQCLNVDGNNPTVGKTEASLARHTSEDWIFGGVAARRSVKGPSCKHMLAAVLAKVAPALFSDSIPERVVTREEIVAWGCGWGEFG
jgi:hypothetical protein